MKEIKTFEDFKKHSGGEVIQRLSECDSRVRFELEQLDVVYGGNGVLYFLTDGDISITLSTAPQQAYNIIKALQDNLKD